MMKNKKLLEGNKMKNYIYVKNEKIYVSDKIYKGYIREVKKEKYWNVINSKNEKLL